MIAFLLKLIILVGLIGWIFSRQARDALDTALRLVRARRGQPAAVDDQAMIREFLSNRDGSKRAAGVSDFYADRAELSPGDPDAPRFWKDSLHLWVFWSLVIPWLFYGAAILWSLHWQRQANIGVAILLVMGAFPLVATAMLPFAYDSPRDFSLRDFMLLVLCGAVAASFVSSAAIDPSQENADMVRLILVWPVYQVALSLFGVLHWIKERLF